MNIFAFTLSLLASASLAAHKEDNLPVESRGPVGSLIKMSIKGSPYQAGCELAKLENYLTTETHRNQITMSVNTERFEEIFMKDWKESPPLSVLFSELFNMSSLKKDLENLTSLHFGPISFSRFRWLLSRNVLFPEAQIVADVAILKWIVQAIDEASSDKAVKFSPYDLKVVCSLSLTPNLWTDYLNDIDKVLQHIPELLGHLDIKEMTEYFYTLIALLKHIKSKEILDKVNVVVETFFPYNVSKKNEASSTMYQKFGLYCIMVLGKDHSLIAKLATNVSKETLEEWIDQSQKFSENRLEIYSVCSWEVIFDSEFRGLWNTSSAVAPINSDQTIGWPSFPETLKMGYGRYILHADQTENDFYLCMKCGVETPEEIWKKFTSCSTMEGLQNFLAEPETIRLLLTYGISIWQRKPIRS